MDIICETEFEGFEITFKKKKKKREIGKAHF